MTHARIHKGSLDVDFPINGITALYGPRGAGKTRILECLAGFATPASGRILLDDVILFDAESRVNIAPRQRNVGYVPHHDPLFPHMTLRKNLQFAAQRFPRLDRHRRIADILSRFGLKDVAETPGEVMRGGIARALIGEPKLLLIDDCGVDEITLRIAREVHNCPTLIATRDLNLSCAVADELILLDRGRVVQRGTPRGVIEHPASLDAARLLEIPNLFQATIVALDPGRDSSRLESHRFTLAGPYLPGHFKGDCVWIAVHACDIRVHSDGAPRPNSFAANLTSASQRAHSVRLEFDGAVFADVSYAAYVEQKDNKSWQVEIPAESLRVL